MNKQKKSRRQFLEDSMFATAAAVASASPAFGAKGELVSASPSERLGVAVVGARGRGNSHIAAFAGRRDTQVLYVCDPDEAVGEKRAQEAARRQRNRPAVHVGDFREVLDDPRVDIVSIATPNHWQAVAAIWALRAGKDVYLEKPGSHCIAEGRRVLDEARQRRRICQVGLQCRSSFGIRKAMRFLQAEQLGPVRRARGLCFKRRSPIGPRVDQQPPPGLDYDRWLGPAAWTNVTRQRFHHDWRWQWEFGGGELANQGVHQIDIARWGLGESLHPQRVLSFGGRFGPPDAGETPDTQTVFYDFANSQLAFEVRGLPTAKVRGAKVGVIFEAEEGFLVVASHSSAAAFDPHGRTLKTFAGAGDHFANFLRAVRTRSVDDLNADIEIGHRSSALCHLGNISYRLGRTADSDSLENVLREGGYGQAAIQSLHETLEHLRHNHVEGERLFTIGPQLEFDGDKERFVGHDSANGLLNRTYRDPYGLPRTDHI